MVARVEASFWRVAIAVAAAVLLSGCTSKAPSGSAVDAMALSAGDAGARRPNLLTVLNNTVYLHTIEAPYKVWANDTATTGPRETPSAGYNALAWLTGSGTAMFNVNLEPSLAASVALDPARTIDVRLFVGPYFVNEGVGRVMVSTEILSGATRVVAGAPKDVTIAQGTISELRWSVVPAVDRLDASKQLTWVIRADGATVGMSIGAKDGVKSSIIFPVV